AELRAEAFSKFEVLTNRQVNIVEAGIPENVAPHGAEGPKAAWNQDGIAAGITTCDAQRCGVRLRNSRVGCVKSRCLRCTSCITSSWEKGESVRSNRLEVRRIAIEVPAVGKLACPAKIKGLVVDVPWLATLRRDNGVDLPSFGELALGFPFGKRIGNGKGK